MDRNELINTIKLEINLFICEIIIIRKEKWWVIKIIKRQMIIWYNKKKLKKSKKIEKMRSNNGRHYDKVDNVSRN